MSTSSIRPITTSKWYYITVPTVRTTYNWFQFKIRPIVDTRNDYSLSEASWKKYFSQNISAKAITVIDVSHCYWLPAVKTLRNSIIKLVNLKELNIQGTQLILSHLPPIFKSCLKIQKLSFTLLEKHLDRYKDGKDAMMIQGFGKLSHLKIFTFTLDAKRSIQSWLVILGVLKWVSVLKSLSIKNLLFITVESFFRWCSNCKNLLIDIAYTGKMDTPIGFDNNPYRRIYNRIKDSVEAMLPRLAWMRSLESFYILRRRDDTGLLIDQCMLQDLLTWLFEKQGTVSPWHSLKRLWVEDASIRQPATNLKNNEPPIQTFLFYHPDIELLKHPRFKNLEHLGGINDSVVLQRFENLPNLKFIRGTICNAQVIGLHYILGLHVILIQIYTFFSGVSRFLWIAPTTGAYARPSTAKIFEGRNISKSLSGKLETTFVESFGFQICWSLQTRIRYIHWYSNQ